MEKIIYDKSRPTLIYLKNMQIILTKSKIRSISFFDETMVKIVFNKEVKELKEFYLSDRNAHWNYQIPIKYIIGK